MECQARGVGVVCGCGVLFERVSFDSRDRRRGHGSSKAGMADVAAGEREREGSDKRQLVPARPAACSCVPARLCFQPDICLLLSVRSRCRRRRRWRLQAGWAIRSKHQRLCGNDERLAGCSFPCVYEEGRVRGSGSQTRWSLSFLEAPEQVTELWDSRTAGPEVKPR